MLNKIQNVEECDATGLHSTSIRRDKKERNFLAPCAVAKHNYSICT